MKELPRPKKSFSPEFKDEAVKMVIETSRPIARVAKELGINEGTLGNWVNAYRREHAGEEPPLTVSERARLRELEDEGLVEREVEAGTPVRVTYSLTPTGEDLGPAIKELKAWARRWKATA